MGAKIVEIQIKLETENSHVVVKIQSKQMK